MKTFLISFFAAIVFILPGPLTATTFYVNPGESIQDAIDGSINGDTIIVTEGTYTGVGNRDINFNGKAITLESESGADVTIIDCESTNPSRGFLFISGEDANSVVDGFTIQNAYIVGNGAGICCYDSSSPTISNCIIKLNEVHYPNDDHGNGGGIYCGDNSNPTITYCEITSNSVKKSGGGIYIEDSSPTITDCEITSNSASNCGGGIYCEDSSPAITDCDIIGNSAIRFGCGIYCHRSSPSITNCTINDNIEGEKGGGISLQYDSNAAIDNCTIIGNSVTQYGGGIQCHESNPTIVDSRINFNVAELNGGGMYCRLSGPTITDCTFLGNVVDYNGAGICSVDGWPTISDCIIMSNIATLGGGGIYFLRDNITDLLPQQYPKISESTIFGNTANGNHGGAIYCVDGKSSITNCMIIENMTYYNGGAIACWSSADVTITSCLIMENKAAGRGGGIACKESIATIENCTITRNRARKSGGAIACINSSPTITNCILWDDFPDEIYYDLLEPTLDYSCIEGGWLGAGIENIVADPLITPDGHLTRNSPCIDWCPTGAVDDIDSETRPVDIAGVGYDAPSTRTYDIGSDEFVDADNDGLPDWWEAEYYPDAGGDPDYDTLPNIGEYENGTDPDEGDVDGDGRNDYTEVEDETNPFHPDNAERTYYINNSTSDDSYDGLSAAWDGTHGPKKTIQAGIDATITGWDYKVEVADGIYEGSGNTDIKFNGKAITLSSENSRDMTIIDCHNSGRGIFLNGGEDRGSVIDGFTIRRGAINGGGICCIFSSPNIINCNIRINSADLGGGIMCYIDANPTITNCIIESNAANENGGGIYCREDSSPVITNCTIRSNIAIESGGGIYNIYNSNPTISKCLISDNTADLIGGGIYCHSSSPGINNCTVSGNSADDGGGIFCIYDSNPTMTDCILGSNTASYGHEISLMYYYNQPSTLTVRYSGVQGGAGEAYIGSGCTLDMDGTCIDADPLFVKGRYHDYYLSDIAAGQPADSPCKDAGSDTAVNFNVDELTTRVDSEYDTGTVDMGYHAPSTIWICSITPSESDITIEWKARAGFSYVVEWSTDIDFAIYTEVPVGTTFTWTDVGGAQEAQSYYRVRAQ